MPIYSLVRRRCGSTLRRRLGRNPRRQPRDIARIGLGPGCPRDRPVSLAARDGKRCPGDLYRSEN